MWWAKTVDLIQITSTAVSWSKLVAKLPPVWVLSRKAF